jgi:hypothetical protein
VSAPLVAKVRETLAAGRAEADSLLDAAEAEARTLVEMAAATDRARAEARLERLEALRDEIDAHQRQIESAFVAMAEALAVAALKLAQAAREADFSPPPMPAGLGRAFEVKLSQTREVTFRLAAEGIDRGGRRPPV